MTGTENPSGSDPAKAGTVLAQLSTEMAKLQREYCGEEFENLMAACLTGTVEDVAGRKVLTAP